MCRDRTYDQLIKRGWLQGPKSYFCRYLRCSASKDIRDQYSISRGLALNLRDDYHSA
jgi:hypothetical protein